MLHVTEPLLPFAWQLGWESRDSPYLVLSCSNVLFVSFTVTRLAREIAFAAEETERAGIQEMKGMEVSAVKAASALLSKVRS